MYIIVIKVYKSSNKNGDFFAINYKKIILKKLRHYILLNKLLKYKLKITAINVSYCIKMQKRNDCLFSSL